MSSSFLWLSRLFLKKWLNRVIYLRVAPKHMLMIIKEVIITIPSRFGGFPSCKDSLNVTQSLTEVLSKTWSLKFDTSTMASSTKENNNWHYLTFRWTFSFRKKSFTHLLNFCLFKKCYDKIYAELRGEKWRIRVKLKLLRYCWFICNKYGCLKIELRRYRKRNSTFIPDKVQHIK